MSKRILAIQTAFPGDAILTLPALQILKEKYPETKIDVVAIKSTVAIFDASPVINNVIVFDKKGNHKSLFSVIKFALSLRKNNYQKVFSFHRSLRSSLLSFFIGSSSIGFNTSVFSFLYSKTVKYNKDHHEVQRNLTICNEGEWQTDWKILPQLKSEAVDIDFELDQKKMIAIAPGSVWETKKLPVEKFTETIKYLVEKHYGIVLIGGVEDKQLCENIAKDYPNKVISLAGNLTIPQSIEVLKNCELLLCNDSAPTHMGMCADIPVLTVYCSTIPEFGFYPYNNKSRTISLDEIECKPCGIHGHNICPKNNFRCGDEITSDKIINCISSMLT